MKKVGMLGLWLKAEEKLAKEGNKEIQQTIEARNKALWKKGLPSKQEILNKETNSQI